MVTSQARTEVWRSMREGLELPVNAWETLNTLSGVDVSSAWAPFELPGCRASRLEEDDWCSSSTLALRIFLLHALLVQLLCSQFGFRFRRLKSCA